MSEFACLQCEKKFDGVAEAIEHIRKPKCSSLDIRRPSSLYDCDSHGNEWYCFECSTNLKDHRSFKSSEAMRQHLSDVHRHCFSMVELTSDVWADNDYDDDYWYTVKLNAKEF